MRKMHAILERLADVLDDVLAYALTIIGILFANYVPMLKSTGTINLKIEMGRIIVAAVVALIIIGKQEYLPNANTETRAGRRKNFVQRMVNALSQGIAWDTIIGMAG
jgi:hypothetical protein